MACITARPRTARAHTQQQPIDESEIQIMLEQMLANRRIEKNECNIKNAKTELKSAIGIDSGIEIWDWNQMLRSHNNLHMKWHTRSNMSVQRRNGHQTRILTWLCPKFYSVLARCVAFRVRCPGPLGSCSTVCTLGVLCRVFGVLGHLASVHRCARSVCCVACAVSWAPWLLFSHVPARCVVLCVLCPGPLGSCSPVCPLCVLCCVCGVLGHLASVHRCARSVCCVNCAVSSATGLLFTVTRMVCSV